MVQAQPHRDVVRRKGGRYYVYSEKTGKPLSKGYRSKKAAAQRLGQIEWFKAHPRTDGRKRVPRKLPPQKPPAAIEALLAKRVVRMLVPALKSTYKHVLRRAPQLAQAVRERRDAPENHDLDKLLATAQRDMRGRLNDSQLNNLGKRMGQQVATHQRLQLVNQVRDVIGIDVPERDPVVAARVDEFARENARLIKRIPEAFHDDVAEMTREAVSKGQLGESLRKDIEKRFGVAERHARLIARDQVQKLYSDINHHRQRKLGITKGIWRTVKDERVRGNPDGKYPDADPSHWDLEGLVLDMNDEDTWPEVMPGETGLPGDAVQCRCYLEPVLDDLLDDEDEDDMTPDEEDEDLDEVEEEEEEPDGEDTDDYEDLDDPGEDIDDEEP